MIGWSLLYAAILVLFGYALMALIAGRSRRSVVEIAGLSLLLGAGGIGMMLLWLSMLGLRPGRGAILALGVIGILMIVNAAAMKRLPPIAFPRRAGSWMEDALSLLPILALLAANLVAMIPSLGMPLFEWDAFVIWGLKAKVLYESPLSPMPAYFGDVRFSYSHLDYPLLLPALMAGAYAMIGQVDDQWGKVVLPILLAGQTLMAYTGARLWLRRLPALVVALLLVGAPFNVQWAGMGNADSALATFRLGSIVYLIRWTITRERTDLVLCALLTVFCAMTKSEGLALLGITVLIVLALTARVRSWKQLAIFVAIVGLAIGIWLIWSSGIPRTDENYPARLTPANLHQGSSRLGLILRAMARGFIDFRTWGAIWTLVPIVTALGFRAFKTVPARILWMLLLSHWALYVLVFMITPHDVARLLPVTVSRLNLHMLPAAMLLIAVHWGSIMPQPRGTLEADAGPERS